MIMIIIEELPNYHHNYHTDVTLKIAIPTRKVGLGHSWKSRWTHIRSKNNILKSSSYTIWMISHGKMGAALPIENRANLCSKSSLRIVPRIVD